MGGPQLGSVPDDTPVDASEMYRRADVTIRLDDDALAWFRRQVEDAGGGNYQTLINLALREHIGRQAESLEDILRRVIREELRNAR